MVQEISYDKIDAMSFVESHPSVSIILPFEPKMAVHRELEYKLHKVSEQVENELMKTYMPERARPVIDRLKMLIRQIDFTSFKRSVAIFVSPEVEKIYYLDIPVEEKVVIDEPFEIRDVVYSKKDVHKYLVLILNKERSEVFLGDNADLFCIVSNQRGHISDTGDTQAQLHVSNDPARYIQEASDEFFRHIDKILGHILNAYDLPLFILGANKKIEFFKTITQHDDRVINYVNGDFEGCTQSEIKKAIAPYVGDWKKVKERDIILQLRVAKESKKLSIGIQEVWKQAICKKGRLLIVERSYMHSRQQRYHKDTTCQKGDISGTAFFIKDAVDDVIANVLENGGDVEFVDKGVLRDYSHIALIQHYYH
jgi:hypothetical protein